MRPTIFHSLLLCAALGFFLTLGRAEARAEAPKCESLTLRQCVTTKGCFLDCDLKDGYRCSPYTCRVAEGICETTYAQFDLTKEKCEALTGCSYQTAACFCPGPENCACGGGPPPRCTKK